MNLKPIPNYEGLYSLDLNTNQVYSHYLKRYKKLNTHNDGYFEIHLYKNNKQKIFKLHRLIYEIHNGTIPDKMCIDHIDNNKQNNNIENLRLATKQQNKMNTKTQKNNSSGHKCIYITKNNTYKVLIRLYKKCVYCKTFKILEEAIINRNIKLKELHREFANFD